MEFIYTFYSDSKSSRVRWRKHNLIGCIVRVGFSLLSVILMVMGISMLVMFYASMNVLGVVLRANFNTDKRKASPLVPIWYDIPDELNYNNWMGPMRSATLTLYLVPLLQGMLGSLLICHPRLWLAIVIGIVGILAIIVQSVNFVQLFYFSGSTHQTAIRELKKAIAENYEVVPGNLHSAALNIIMIMKMRFMYLTKGECCGIEGPGDFSKSRLTVNFTVNVNPYDDVFIPNWMDLDYAIPAPNLTYRATFKHPPVCCNSSVYSIENETQRFEVAANCSSEPKSKYLIETGCYSYYFNTYIRICISVGYFTSLVIGTLWIISGLLTPFVVEDIVLE